MFKALLYFLLIIILLALSITSVKFFGMGPNFLFLLTIVYAFQKNNPDYLWLAFFSGLMLDIYSNVFFGTYILSFLLISVSINYATRIFFSADPSVVYLGLMTAISSLMLVGLLFIFNSLAIRFQSDIMVLPTIYLKQKIWIDLAFNLVFLGPIYYLSGVVEGVIISNSKRRESFT
ncbi:MAG: hypothetical protein NVSMB66_0910 [Candidatus Doudnabacteria bacterium]